MTNNKSVIYKLQPDFVAPKVQFKVPGLGTRENHGFCPARGVTFGSAAMQNSTSRVSSWHLPNSAVKKVNPMEVLRLFLACLLLGIGIGIIVKLADRVR